MSVPERPCVLISEDQQGVRMLRLNRPDKLNALNTELTQALYDALRSADRDGDIRSLVLAGEGRALCAGGDLSEFDQLTVDNWDAVAYRAELTCQLQMTLQRLKKPIVSVAQGVAMGGGAGLAIACDMMVVVKDLQFGYPELKHSIVPAVVMTGLQRHFGRKLAFELISTGRILSGEELFELGIANTVCEDAKRACEVALTVARTWSQADPKALSATKELFYRIADLPFEAAMRAGRDMNMIMRNFREKA
ncbi:MAG: enoyl-CoA hydratase/isomerase family protein [Acidimicrobiales bacterium]